MIRLSASKLNLFNECPRCFWLSEKCDIKRPRGPFPTLPGGMDAVLKRYFDQYLGTVPPELNGKVPGVLFGKGQEGVLKQMRNWRTGLQYINDTVSLIGALDSLLVDGDRYYPLDFKTKGWAPKDSGEQYYQTQLDLYGLLLQENGYLHGGKGFLVYFFPLHANVASEEFLPVYFGSEVFTLSVEPDRAREVIRNAVECLAGPIPDPGEGQYGMCEYCAREFATNQALSHTTQGI